MGVGVGVGVGEGEEAVSRLKGRTVLIITEIFTENSVPLEVLLSGPGASLIINSFGLIGGRGGRIERVGRRKSGGGGGGGGGGGRDTRTSVFTGS